MKTLKYIIFLFVLNIVSIQLLAQPLFETSFAKGEWKQDEWIMVKSPRWSYIGKWVQGETFIQNKTPDGATPEEMLGTKSSETYTSMVLKNKFSGEITVKVKMEFADRMAPIIVFAPELGKDKNGIHEYREHFEVVLWDEGINIWHHYYKNGKPFWKLAAFERFPLKPDTQYELKVKFSKRKSDKLLSVNVNGHEFGYMDNSLPNEFYVGITGCEGINRFYSFVVTKE